MRLAFTDGLIVTNHFDDEMRQLADRHYSRRTIGARQFCYSGRKLVLRDTAGLILFVWMFPDPSMRMDKQIGYNNAIFHNESLRPASEIILEAETFAIQKWGPHRAYTFIEARKLATRKCHGAEYCPWPVGRCYLRAGWRFSGFTKSGKHIFEKSLHASPSLAS
jgi:hypothetical protein